MKLPFPALLLASLVASSCRPTPADTAPAAHPAQATSSPTAASAVETPPCCRKPLDSGPASDKSLYLLESDWTSDVGRRIRLGQLRGRPQVVALFFTRCEYACPILVHDMKRIEEALPPAARAQVDFLLVSMDSERDDPASLADFRRKNELATARWTLLTGAADDVRELAALLGVSYQKDARGQFAHSNLLTVLNAGGEVVHQLKGLNQSVEEAVRLIASLPSQATNNQAPTP